MTPCPFCATEPCEPCAECGRRAERRTHDDVLRSLGFTVEDAAAPRWRAEQADIAARGGYAPKDLENRS